MRVRKLETKPTELEYFRKIKAGLDGFVPFSEMEEIKIVPTILTSYNRATGRGGQPLGRIMVIHGPPQVGKTVLGLAIVESLAKAGFPGFVYDTEFASETKWYNHICRQDGIVEKEIVYLEELEEDTRSILKMVADLHGSRGMPKDVGVSFLVDTLTKPLPKDIMVKIEKEGIDKLYPIQALHISTWSKEIVPKLARTNSVLIAVLQERQKIGAMPFEKKYNVTLGSAIQYDNTLRVRVSHAEKVTQGDQVVGVKCNFVVENNKICGTTWEDGALFTANGKGDCPLGLDLVMEAMYEAKMREWIVKRVGEMILKMGDETIELGRDFPKSIVKVRKDEKLFARLVKKLNSTAVESSKESVDEADQ